MKLGFSSYSFRSSLESGEMTLLDVIDWVAESEGEHLELASTSIEAASHIPNRRSDDSFVKAVAEHSAERGVPLSNLAIGANFFIADETERRAQIEHVKAYVDLAQALGITRMRHDVTRHSPEPGKPNFKTTLDVGNFLCVDENPTAAVPANLPLAMTVHLKDFYVRPANRNPGEGWFRSRGGKYLRCAIVGNGDMDTYAVMRSIKESGYDGPATIEFEGDEDWRIGTTRGLANAARIYAEV